MKKTLITFAVVAVLIGVGAFYGGMKYGQSNIRGAFAGGNQQRLQQLGANIGGARGAAGANGAGFVSGDIISADNSSITVKLRDGGSKIVFFTNTTEISKFVSGISGDLKVGETVTITGKSNQDGSVSAQSVQIRPAVSPIVSPAAK